MLAMRTRLMSYLLWAIFAYVLFGGVLFGCQRSLLYHPNQVIPDPHEYGLENVTVEKIKTDDGYSLLAWWHQPQSADTPVIVYFHGNAGNLGHRAEKIRPYISAGYGVLIVSYRYNAGAGGSPSEAGLYADGRAAVAFVKNTGISSDRLVMYGESLGTAIAVKMATETEVRAVVLESPYSSIADVAQSHYWYVPAKFLLHDKFDAAANIGQINAPLFVIHGERDAIIPIKFSRALFAAAKAPKTSKFLAAAGHNNLYEHGAAQYIQDFLEGLNPHSKR